MHEQTGRTAKGAQVISHDSMLYPNGEFSLSSLGSSMPVKSHKPPKSVSVRDRRGKAQTTFSKRKVRNGCAELQRRFTRRLLAFVTTTLDDSFTEEEDEIIRETWFVTVKAFRQEIERDLERAGLHPEVICITEIQEKRYKRLGQVKYHLHLVFQSKANIKDEWAIDTDRLTELWNRQISNRLGREVNMPYATKIEVVKRSAEGYMSKYMSKGSRLSAKVENDGLHEKLPKSWWSMTETLSKWVDENTKILSDNDKCFLREAWEIHRRNQQESMFQYCFQIQIEMYSLQGEPYMVNAGLVGKIKPQFIKLLETKRLCENVFDDERFQQWYCERLHLLKECKHAEA